MTVSVFHRLFGLVNGESLCLGCGLPENEITHPTRFERGDISILVCQNCGRDYLEWSGETIEETVARSKCDPREVLFWGRRQ
jgi:hypothetical protein